MRSTILLLAACSGSPMAMPSSDTLATDLKHAGAVAIDQTSIYWVEGGTDANNNLDGAIMKARLDGSEVVTLVYPVDDPGSIALDATHVYWSTYGTNKPAYLMKAALDGTGVTTIVTLPTSTPTSIAVDASSIYWTDVFAGTVSKALLDGSGITRLASDQLSPEDIAVAPSGIYWLNGGVNATPGSIMKLTGTSLTTLAGGQREPGGLVLDATYAYWGTSDSDSTGSIKRVALDGAGLTTIATGPYVEPWSVAVTGDAVYWVNQGADDIVSGMTVGDGGIMRANLDGTAVTALAARQPNPRSIAVSATDVYWTTGGTNEGAYQDGTLERAPR